MRDRTGVGIQIVMVNLSRHVFGSDQGYRTLATSDDLTPNELAELESFVFGQTNDAPYLMSLSTNPAYWSRQLSSGRRAVTRVFLGPKDDQGRQSLRFVTAILFSAEWISALNGEDAALIDVDTIWAWDGKPRLPRLEVRVTKPTLVRPSAEQRGHILSLLGMIESMSDSPETSIVVEERQMDPAELTMALALLPVWYRPKFSYGFRSLSEALPVQLNYLAPCASRGKSRRKITRWAPRSGYATAKYAAGLAHFWPEGDSPPWEFVENCKAFGDLLPTWEGTDVATGTVAPPEPTPKERRRRQKRRIRIPKVAYLVAVMLAVVTATAFVTVRTVQSRRNADAVLAAAEAFLSEHPDSSQLPAAGHERKKLIESAQGHADKVADLDDTSRADRQNSVATELRGWLDAAGERATKYGSLDDMLAGFATFSGPLGLEQPGAMVRIPDAVSRSAVLGWKKRLEQAQGEADVLGDPYPARIAGAHDRIGQWDMRVNALLQKCSDGLDQLEKALAEPLPTSLSNDQISNWEGYKDQLTDIGETLPPVPPGQPDTAPRPPSDDRFAKLHEQRQRIEAQVERWDDRIAKLTADIERYMDRAKDFIKQQGLEFDPVRADALAEPWKAAADAQSALKQALDQWPDSDEALALLKTVTDWMDKASVIAMVHFREAFSQADSIWFAEKQRVQGKANANSNGVPDLPPNPGPALAALEDALNYWKNNSEAIKHFDASMATDLHIQATSRHGVLLTAKSQYDAAAQPPGQPTNSSSP